MPKTYTSPVRGGWGNCGEYVQVRMRRGRVEARTIELFTHGPERVGPWEPATFRDLDATRAPREWEKLIEN